MPRLIALTVTLFVVVPATAQPVGPVGTVSGPLTTGSISRTTPPFNFLTVQLSGTGPNSVDGNSASGTSFFQFGNATISGPSSTGSGTSYALSGGNPIEQYTFSNATANFTPTLSEAVVLNSNTAVLLIRGTKTLSSQTGSGYDFGSTTRVWTFEVSVSVPGISNFNTLLTSGGAADSTTTGAFTGQITNTAPVPEPAFLTAFGAAALGGVTWVRRRGERRESVG